MSLAPYQQAKSQLSTCIASPKSENQEFTCLQLKHAPMMSCPWLTGQIIYQSEWVEAEIQCFPSLTC